MKNLDHYRAQKRALAKRDILNRTTQRIMDFIRSSGLTYDDAKSVLEYLTGTLEREAFERTV